MVRKVWAASTWKLRIGLWKRWQKFHRLQGTSNTDVTMAAFIEAQAVSKQTKHSYAGQLAAVATRVEMPTSFLRMYIQGLAGEGGIMLPGYLIWQTNKQVKQVLHSYLPFRGWNVLPLVACMFTFLLW